MRRQPSPTIRAGAICGAAGAPRAAGDRRRAMAAGRNQPPPGLRSWSAHLLGCSDPHEAKAALDDLPDGERQFQPRARKLWIVVDQEAAARIVVAAVPQRMEFRS